jgi:drug/metabolite transporter (DMT)-like permease
MTPSVVGLVLCAAVLHAAWNAMLRGGKDRLQAMTVMSFATTAVALPVAAVLPVPDPASWPYIGLSTALQIGYSHFLVRAYRDGEFGQVYPIARGAAPLLVTLGAAVLTGEVPSQLSLVGVVLVSLGIVSLARARRTASPAAIAAALATGCSIASYTVSDGIGSRLSGHALAYSAWMFVLYGIAMPLTTLAVRGRIKFRPLDRETLSAAAGGIVSLTAYTAIIWAVSLNPMGPVSALRETSVVFAAVIGRLFLNETLSASRLLACLVIAVGAICLSWV